MQALRPTAAAQRLGISLPTLWRKVRADSSFPRPIKLSPRVTVFLERDLDSWLAEKAIAAGR
jgi:prophage regulatory protein